MSWPLRFSANLKWLFGERRIEERPAAAAEAGFRAIEHPQPYDLPAARWGQVLSDAGVAQVLLNTPTGPSRSDTEFGAACVPGARSEFRAGFDRALQYAVAVGCPLINVMAGVQPPTVIQSQAADTYLENLTWAAAECGGTDVTLVIEAVNPYDRPGAFIQRQEHAADIIGLIGSDRVRLLLDLYHCQIVQGNLARTFQLLTPLIGHVQVADVPTRAEPGTGEINYSYLLDLVRSSDYTGWIGCEYAPSSSTEASLSWLPPDHQLTQTPRWISGTPGTRRLPFEKYGFWVSPGMDRRSAAYCL
jgi:hydroxypyruvate isomerase